MTKTHFTNKHYHKLQVKIKDLKFGTRVPKYLLNGNLYLIIYINVAYIIFRQKKSNMKYCHKNTTLPEKQKK